MKTKWTLFLVGGMSGTALATVLAGNPDLQPMIVNSLTGTLRVQQSVPCADDVDLTKLVTGGRLEIAPTEGVAVGDGKAFTLTRANVFFQPFSVHRDCLGVGDTRTYTEIGVQLGKAVSFTAPSTGPGVYAITIPKENFLIYQAAIVNGDPDTGFKRPREDVTGTLNLTDGTLTDLHVVVATRIHFKGGCFDPCVIGSCEICAIDETRDGTLTANISGTIAFPDSDGDGVADRADNCKFVANPDQTPVPTPVISAPADVTLASCADHHIGVAKASEVCDGRAVTVTNNAPLTFATGTNVITWSANDGLHPIVTDTQNVTIVDTTPPVITSVPPDLALNDCRAADLGLPTATDDCAGTPTFTNNAPPKFFVGTTVVTWTAHDASGNTSTATQNVVVTDTVAPTELCVPTNPTGTSFRVSATDACDTPVIRLGSFVLANGEVVKIQETGQPGVRLINQISSDNIRHFQVGKGENVISATDASGNVATAVCR